LFAGAQHRNPHPVFLPRGKIGKSIFAPAAAMRFPNAFVRQITAGDFEKVIFGALYGPYRAHYVTAINPGPKRR